MGTSKVTVSIGEAAKELGVSVVLEATKTKKLIDGIAKAVNRLCGIPHLLKVGMDSRVGDDARSIHEPTN